MNEDPQSYVTEINGCISTAAKRQHGLLKLAVFLETCQSKDQCSLLEKNSAFWIKTILQILENHPISIHAKLAQYCFYLLIQNSKQIGAELSRMISTNFIEKSISLLITSNEQLSKNSLACLNELMSNYRGACSQFRQKIETFVLNKMDSNSNQVIEWACKCYSKLPYLHKSQNTNDIWYIYFKNALKSANIILNELFEEYQSSISVESESLDLSLNESKSTGVQNKSDNLFNKINKENLEFYLNKSLKRFKACLLALTYLFEPLNEQVIVKVKLNEILNFLKRVYFFDFKKLAANTLVSLEAKYLNEIISDLFNTVLKFTTKFISIANTSLIPNSNLINQMLANLGSNLNDKTLFNSIPVFYECLTDWITTIGGNSGFYNYSSSFIDVILSNITPHKSNLLAIEKNSNKSCTKGTSNDKKELLFNNKSILNNYQLEIRSQIIVSALKCLKAFIKKFNYEMNYNHFEKIQQTLIGIILSIQNNYNGQKPYDQAKCRIELYRNLYELCMTKSSKLAPPLAISICVFRNALDDDSNEIKTFAQDSLNSLRAFTCPILPVYIKEFKLNVNQSDQQMDLQLDQSMQSIVNLTSNSNTNKQSFILNQQQQQQQNQFSFNHQHDQSNNKILINDVKNNYSENSSSTITNSNSYSNGEINKSNSLKRKQEEYADSNQTNASKVFLTDNKKITDNTTTTTATSNNRINNNQYLLKNLKVNQTEDSNGNEEEDEEEEEEEEEIEEDEDDEDIEEEDDEEIDEEDDEEMSNNDEKDVDSPQISGIKKLETSKSEDDNVIAIDSDEDDDDTNADGDEFEGDEDFDEENDYENEAEETNSSNNNNNKSEKAAVENNDIHKKVNILLNACDYEDDDDDDENNEDQLEQQNEREQVTENGFEETNSTSTKCENKIKNKENLSVDDNSKKLHEEKENISNNILKSPVTRGSDTSYSEAPSNNVMIVTENNQEVDNCSFKASSDEVINNNNNPIEKIVGTDLIEKSQVKFADLVVAAQPENQKNICVNNEPDNIQMIEEIKTLTTDDDLNIKEMCNTFNPEALAIDNNKLEENNKIE